MDRLQPATGDPYFDNAIRHIAALLHEETQRSNALPHPTRHPTRSDDTAVNVAASSLLKKLMATGDSEGLLESSIVQYRRDTNPLAPSTRDDAWRDARPPHSSRADSFWDERYSHHDRTSNSGYDISFSAPPTQAPPLSDGDFASTLPHFAALRQGREKKLSDWLRKVRESEE
jgi:hypothetical protein